MIWEDSLSISERLKGFGQVLSIKNGLVFFSDDRLTGDTLKQFNIKISELWQVHDIKLVEAAPTKDKADAQWTSKSNIALLIKTADCIPAFLSDGQQIIGLHAGWRGVQKRILSQVMSQFENPKKFQLWLGPHIHQTYFELGDDIANEIFHCHGLTIKSATNMGLSKPSNRQRRHQNVDLTGLFKREALQLGINNVWVSPVDTYTSPNHYSHRRNPWRRGQNFSFILKF